MALTRSLNVPTQSDGTGPENVKLPFVLEVVTTEPSQDIALFLAALPSTTAAPAWTCALEMVMAACASEPNPSVIESTIANTRIRFMDFPPGFPNDISLGSIASDSRIVIHP